MLRCKRAAKGEPLRFIHDVALTHEGDECLIWPFGRSGGYGRVKVDGAMRWVHRIVCTLAHGDPTTPEHEAAHSCGRGHLGCVNPGHLSWKTHAENMADMKAHGTHQCGELHPRARLSVADVARIRALRGKLSQRRIAILFGISHKYVSDIQTGYRWGHIAP